MADWPSSAAALVELQSRLAEEDPAPWRPSGRLRTGGCWATFPRGLTGRGGTGDPVWGAAVVMDGPRVLSTSTVRTVTLGPYQPGLLALRLGPALEAATRRLSITPDVLLLDATARDHPRRAGLALHLGAVLDLPTVGVTHRPLLATGQWPRDERGATSALTLDGEQVGCWLRTRAGTRPVAVHPGWRVDPATAVDLVREVARHRTPEPLRQARHVARRARVDETGRADVR